MSYAKPSRILLWVTKHEGVQCSLAHCRIHNISFSLGRLPLLWFGTGSTLPSWLVQQLHTSRRRGTRRPSSGVRSLAGVAGVLHSTSSRVGCLDCWGSPVISSRAAELLRPPEGKLSLIHCTKPNFPAERKFSTVSQMAPVTASNMLLFTATSYPSSFRAFCYR